MLMLTNDLIQKAKNSELDTIKAFDCLSWDFLYALLDIIGFGLYFTSMAKATNKTTSSIILI